MSPTNVLAGVFLFLLGAALMGAYAYRSEIRTLLNLQKSGAIDAASDLYASAASLVNQFAGKKVM